jgi:hypothetical protein
MSFRDSVQEDNASANQPEFHPLLNLIDNIRSNMDARRQARHRSGPSRSFEDEGNPPDTSPARQLPHNYVPCRMPADFPYSNQPAPYARPASYTRPGETAPFRVSPFQPEPPGVRPEPAPFRVSPFRPETPGEKADDSGDQTTDRITERVLPDSITVKERNGAVREIPEEKQASADDRLNKYLQVRGRELAELDLSGSSISDSGLALLRNAPNLAKLMLNDTDITNDSMQVLARQGLQNLQDLNLSSTRVADEGIAQLKGLPLKALNISDTATSDDCMRDIKTMRGLQVLTADYSGVGNEGVKSIKEMPSLRSLSLKGCPITDDCIRDLAACQNLMLLNLEDTKLTPANVRLLQRQLPHCVVVAPEGQGGTQRLGHRKPFLERLFRPSPRH